MKNSIKKAQIIFVITIIGIFTASNTLAYKSNFDNIQGQLPSGAGINNINGIINILVYILQSMYTIFFVVAVIMIILAAYKYLTGASDPKKIEEAHQQIIWAVVAIAVALVALSVNLLVKNFLQTGAGGGGDKETGITTQA